MKKNVLVEFYNVKKSYDPETSTNKIDETKVGERYCNVSILSRERSLNAYGEYIKKGVIIRLTTKINFEYSLIKIKNEAFKVFDEVSAGKGVSIIAKGVEM